jgi:hypothetical protein
MLLAICTKKGKEASRKKWGQQIMKKRPSFIFFNKRGGHTPCVCKDGMPPFPNEAENPDQDKVTEVWDCGALEARA